ncbi:MAG: AMP-binding protein [Halothece sp.]
MTALNVNLPSESFSTLVSLLLHRAEHQPNELAFTFLQDGETETASFTYGELHQAACRIGAHLQALNLAGERALILHAPGWDYLSALFGCWYAGVVAVPAYPPQNRRNAGRIQSLAVDAQIAAVFTEENNLAKTRQWLDSVLDIQSLYWFIPEASLQERGDNWKTSSLNEDTLALLQYTSGSTGTPKGVMLSHRNLLTNSGLIQKAIESGGEDVIVTWLPPYHDMGLIGAILQPLYVGCPCIWMPPVSFLQQPYRWLKAISDYQGTISVAPNFGYDLCVNKISSQQRQSLDLRSWRVALAGAEPIRAHTLNQFTNTFAECGFQWESFYPCYGLAEATLFVTGSDWHKAPTIQHFSQAALKVNRAIPTDDPEDAQAFVSCGKPPQEQEIAIVNPETLTRVCTEEVGEIWVAGASVAQGYWRKDQETAQTFQASLPDAPEKIFLRTGDLGTYQQGELYITGRRKDLIIIRGQNYYPQDIEETVEQAHSGLRKGCGAAFGMTQSDTEQLAVVQEVERRYRRQPLDPLIQAIREAISAQHDLQVATVVLIKPTTIPKTSSGKIQRRACRQMWLEGELDVLAEWHLPTNDNQSLSYLIQELTKQYQQAPPHKQRPLLEAYVCAQIAKALCLPSPETIDMNKSFLALGMDSLTGATLANELENHLGISLASTFALEYPTVNALVTELETKLSTTTNQLPTTPFSTENPFRNQEGEFTPETLQQLPEEQLDAFLQEMIQDES